MEVPSTKALDMNGSPHLTNGYLLGDELKDLDCYNPYKCLLGILFYFSSITITSTNLIHVTHI